MPQVRLTLSSLYCPGLRSAARLGSVGTQGPLQNLPREKYTHNLLSQSWVVTEAEEAEPVF